MKLFRDNTGDMHPVSRIRRINPLPRRAANEVGAIRNHRVVLENDDVVYVSEIEIDQLEGTPTNFLPALPNTFILGSVFSEYKGVEDVWHTPVIAWGVYQDGEVKPWTVDGADDGMSQPCPLLMPNGMVILQGDRSYRTATDWFNEEHAEVIKRAAVETPEAE